ncbi:MAG: polyprenyl synthetase family protein [Desulfobulbaceae bacterium]
MKSFVNREAALVDSAMRRDLDEALAGCDPLLGEVLEYALLGGGKRIRPLLTILASHLCGRKDESLYRLATAFEYLHAATLVHDDVIDNAAARRGKPSTVEKFGREAAILAGDWLHARSMYLVARHAGVAGLDVFCRCTMGMVDGEFLQLRFAADPDVSDDQYFSVIHRKTALLIGSTCEIGAVYAEATAEQRRALAGYGEAIGCAFQIVDDLLDYQGEARNTGKKVGNDFAEGKMTLPLIRALATAGGKDREEMAALLAGDRDDPAALDRFIGLVARNDGFLSARETAERYAREAVSSLNVFEGEGDSECLGILRELAGYVLDRKK